MHRNIVSLFKRFGRRVFQNRTSSSCKPLAATKTGQPLDKKLKTTVRTLILIFLLTSLKTIGQDIDLYTKYYDRNDAKKKFRKELNVSDSTIIKNSGDTLTTFFKTNMQSGFIKLNFLQSSDEFAFKYCVRQELILDCSECSTKFIESLLKAKGWGWKKVGDNTYVSNYFAQSQLKITYKDKEKYCTTLIFTYIDKPKKEYKAWYKSLNVL
jgi:hypothetical protein